MNVSLTLTSTGRQAWVGLRLLLVATVLLGVAYPAAVWAAGRAVPGDDATIGQDFPVADDGWFHGRPSANDYDGLASAPSNLGPSNPDLLALIDERRAAIAEVEGIDPALVPADALTASGSGLDPFISPEYATLQVDRVAEERGLPVTEVEQLVDDHTSGRQLGFLGQPRVDVVALNRALDQALEGAD
ncbi:potassium-transporting ATPase subunit C [Aeromicrobium sp. Leaf350]|uniref:potassium-transporting ATPase subunit C n=1 Tax=Aeromicrobium sp. Leaf350 TaxID=2876565 RepID=UPI001E32805B|nr:potassium-transporting ATPase subunit C [Aeromicrobium sp. Leaf350]